MLHTLPIIAVLKTKNGIILRYIDGSETQPLQMDSLPLYSLCECERGMIKLACTSTGWVTDKYYYEVSKM